MSAQAEHTKSIVGSSWYKRLIYTPSGVGAIAMLEWPFFMGIFLTQFVLSLCKNTLLSQEHKEAKVLILEEEGLRTQSKRNRNNTISLKQ